MKTKEEIEKAASDLKEFCPCPNCHREAAILEWVLEIDSKATRSFQGAVENAANELSLVKALAE